MRDPGCVRRLMRAAVPTVVAGVLAGVGTVAEAQSRDSTPAAAPPSDSAAAPVGTAAIDGTVTDAAGRALAGAVVTADGLAASDLTTSRGVFAVRGLPTGPRRFLVRRVGFQPAAFELDLPEQATVHLQVTLRPSVVMLGAIVVEGESRSLGLFRSGFYERAVRQPQGYFYPPEEMERRQLSTLATLLTEVPGLLIERRNGEAIALGRAIGTARCELNLWVDGALARAATAPLDQLAPAHLVRAVEVYPSASTVPEKYVRQNNRCGAVVIWTRGVVG